MVREFFKSPAAGAVILFFATAVALILSNSTYKGFYSDFIYHNISIGFGEYYLKKPLEIWVNEGLMAIFFFHIGLELKKEAIHGALADRKNIIVPAAAALGGMIFPAIIYLIVTKANYIRGWAIPTATDIAFSLGICGLLQKKIPKFFRTMLMSVAIFDDLGAVLIIAIFYSASLSTIALISSSVIIFILYLLKLRKFDNLTLYFLLGLMLWLAVVKSGVHATLSGFILAMFIPNAKIDKLEKLLHPWVSFLIMPMFAIINAGIDFSSVGSNSYNHPISLGIILGLALGKPLGIFSGIKIAKYFLNFKFNLSNLGILGLGALCGVGFTMSLFIGTLAFSDLMMMNYVKIGVIVGSLIMGLLGYTIVYFSYRR